MKSSSKGASPHPSNAKSSSVVVVSDGLKAWEVLKGKSQHIDLILTEVELPSISGFAFLTLITEHQVCKNIPVIMMSAQDSISTVYKCMLRGAADFLVKPVRKNELKVYIRILRSRSSASSLSFRAIDFESSSRQKTGAADFEQGKATLEDLDIEQGSHLQSALHNHLKTHGRRMSTPERKRLMRDFKRLQQDPPAGIIGAPVDNNIMLWNAVIFG
ncbi:hypothetical protein LXL04_003722 [Taraxacum kok-saghyz]